MLFLRCWLPTFKDLRWHGGCRGTCVAILLTNTHQGPGGPSTVDPGELLGASWGLLGRFVAHEAPKNLETRSEGTAKTRPRGPRWPPGGPQEGPTYPQEGPKTVPKGFENDIQEKKTKTSKSTTISIEKLDF